MRACIVGCGAIGCLLAGFLWTSLQEPPACIVRRREHRDTLERYRCRLGGLYSMEFPVDPYLTGELEDDSCSYAIVSVKAYDAPRALLEAYRLSPVVAVAVNGFIEAPRDPRGRAVLLELVVDYGATRKGDGYVEVTGVGRIIIGSPPGARDHALQLSRLLQRGGADVVVVDDITGYRWAKAAVNAGINPVTALLGVRNGFIVEDKWARSIAVEAASEVARVAEALGIRLPYDPVEYMLRVAERTRDNKSSMLQDVEAGRRTEADEILGYIVRRAREAGVEAPILRHLYMLIKALEDAGGRRCRNGRR